MTWKGFDDDESSNNEEVHEKKILAITEGFLKLCEEYDGILNSQKRKTQALKAQLKTKNLEMSACLKTLNINRKIMAQIVEDLAASMKVMA